MKNTNKDESAEYFLWRSDISGPFDLNKISEELFRRLQKKIPNAGGALMITSPQKEIIQPSVFIDQEKFIYRAVDKLLKKPLHEFQIQKTGKNPIAISWRDHIEIEGSIEDFCVEMIPNSIAKRMGVISKRRRLMAFPIQKEGVLVVSNTKPLNESQKEYIRQQSGYIAELISSINSYKSNLSSHLDRIMKLQRVFGQIFSSKSLLEATQEAEAILSDELKTKVKIKLTNSEKEHKRTRENIKYESVAILHESQNLGFVLFKKPIKQTDRDLLQIIAKELGLAIFVATESIKVRMLINELLLRGLPNQESTPTVKFTLRLTPSLNANIELLASQKGTSKADFMRDLLQQGIDNEMGMPGSADIETH